MMILDDEELQNLS